MQTTPITLHELIDHVREELLSPRETYTPESIYPFLFVDGVEIELSVTITRNASASGKIAIYVAEIGAGAETSQEKGQVIKVKLSPLMPKEETLKNLRADERVWNRISQISRQALMKSESGVEGPEE